MTDYYITGSGYTAYGPYHLDEARVAAELLANDEDGDFTVHILGTVETPYSRVYNDNVPEKPDVDEDDIYTPWRN